MSARILTKHFLLPLLGGIITISGLIWFFRSDHPDRGKINNVLLISIDTWRADHVGCYGYPGDITPNIDALAKQAVLFRNVVTTVPMTLPAHCSMLTGTVPPYHGVHDNADHKLGQDNITLAELLKGAGFATGAVISTFVLDSKFGLDQGFDAYDDRFEDKSKSTGIGDERRGAEASRVALNWIDGHKDHPFFLLLHYYDPHLSYAPPEPFASKFRHSPYAGEVAYADHCTGEVINKLKELNLYDSTLIIIVGDHGEMLGEHGEDAHCYFIYQSAIRVPLIIRLPGQYRAKDVGELASLIDIVPTVCGLLHIEAPKEVQGTDLSAYIHDHPNPPADRYLYTESFTPTMYEASSLLGIVTNRWKYIQTTRPELYDLLEDPQESNNLAAAETQRARELQDDLKEILAEGLRKSPGSRVELDEQTRRRLRSLGYVSSGVSAEFVFDQSKEDPKDLIVFHQMHGEIQTLRVQKKNDQARRLCEELLRMRPDSMTAHDVLAGILTDMGDFAAAIPLYQKILERRPEDGKAHSALGFVLMLQGQLDQAVEHLLQGIKFKPQDPYAYRVLGIILLRQKRLDEALNYLLAALKLDPESAATLYQLGEAMVSQGKADEAVNYYRQALQIEPDNILFLRKLGGVLKSKGRFEEAIEHYQQALKSKPDSIELKEDLGMIMIKAGRPEEMIRLFREILLVKPDHAHALNNLAWVLATNPGFGQAEEALHLASKACELTKYQNVTFLDTLAAAYANTGQFDRAVETAQKAVDLPTAARDDNAADQIKKHLELYKQGQPCREP